MIQLPNVSLPERTKRGLARLQSRIDNIADYDQRVSTAKTQFAQNNRPANATFRSIRTVLTRMCSGARRCGYCEDSAADEVEHIRPKDLYPEATFVWENYLYACGPCNGPKNNQFAVFRNATNDLIDITRRRGDPVIPPEPGDPGLIDPRTENPLTFMELDFFGTFFFLPKGRRGSKRYLRAKYTIDVLRLNERDLLPAARKEAYLSYKARLSEYINMRNHGASMTQLNDLVLALKKMGHPSVWQEMKRQQLQVLNLVELFNLVPEALEW